jgi:uncharacterized protein (TIGR03083 family)
VSTPIVKGDILRDIRIERARNIAFLRGLEPEQWETVALPGWRIREVAAHLISLDRASLSGAVLPQAMASAERVERWNDRQVGKFADRPIPEIVVALERWGRRFLRLARAVPAAAYRLRFPTMWGRGPGGLLIWSRVYDEWVHRQDMRRALGLADEDADLAPPLAFMFQAAACLPAMRGGTGTVEVSVKGAPVAPHVFDLAAGDVTVGDAGGEADVRIRASGPAFIMATAGREPGFKELEEQGELEIEGDRAVAERFLNGLKVV